jgi:isopenicillin N synthase-like dioxygenase
LPAPEFDKNGIIKNGTEIRGLINEILENMAVNDLDTTHLENYVQALDDYESTLEAWNDAMEQLVENLNKVIDLGLEIATTKIELNIELEDLELEYLDYMLSKIEDGAWNAASAIGLMT